MTKSNQPYMRCVFRDKRTTVEAPLWSDNRFLNEADAWTEGTPYRLQVRGKYDLRYGMQVDILGIRPATDDDAARRLRLLRPVREQPIPGRRPAQEDPRPDRALHRSARRSGGWWRTSSSEQLALFKKMPAAQDIPP